MSAATILVLVNGDCGIWIAPKAIHVNGFVRATVDGHRGWVKSKWIIRADQL